MSRATILEDEREDFCLYVDEFQNFTTDSFATIMSEARKYRLNLIVANQFTTQLTEEIRDAVFGNMGTIVSFRVGTNDVEALVKYFTPYFDADDLVRVPNYNAIVRTMIGGVPTSPFSMAGLPQLGKPNRPLAEALKQLSAAKYGRPKQAVESEMFERWKVKEPALGSGSRTGSVPSATAKAKPSTSGSFLDEWLAKRRTNPPAQAPSGSLAPPAPTQAITPPTNPFSGYTPPPKAPEPIKAPVVEKPKEDKKPVVKNSTSHPEGPLELNKKSAHSSDPEDTIFIDREGNISSGTEENTPQTGLSPSAN